MLIIWCLFTAQLLAIANLQVSKAEGVIDISDDEIRRSILEAREEILDDGKKEFESTRATCDKPYHAQIKPDLIYGQQKARISEMITRKLADKIG